VLYIVKAQDIMTRDVITIQPETSIAEIARMLHDHRISGLPVVNKDGELLGIVSEGDLIIKLARPQSPPHIELLGGIFFLKRPHEMDDELKKLTAVSARDIMTEKVITVEEDCDIEDLASLMVNRKINRLPVVNSGKLVGIITRADIIETLVEEPAKDSHIPDVT
jgi:CBS domain-containing protein